MHILKYLKQPFPKIENKWRNIVIISIFVALFLFVFQPFGIGRIENGRSKYLLISGFGLVTFIVLIFDLVFIETLFPRFFAEKKWYVIKELGWLFCIIFSIGLGNVLYAISFSEEHLTLAYVVNFQITTFAVAIFPITIFTISKNNHLSKQHTTSANDVNNSLKTESPVSQENNKISLYSYNEKTKEEININDLYYIESKGNDIMLYIYENDIFTTRTLRNTLKKSLGYLAESPEMAQCHRAYIVNLSKVNKVSGNSQGLMLYLINCDAEVPVSRSFVGTIKSKLQQQPW